MKRPVRAYILAEDGLDLPILGTDALIDGAKVCVSATAAVVVGLADGMAVDAGGSGGGVGSDAVLKATSKKEAEAMRQAEIARVQQAIAAEAAVANKDEIDKIRSARENVGRVREAYKRRIGPSRESAEAKAAGALRENVWLTERAAAVSAGRAGELKGVIGQRERLPAFEHRSEILEAVLGPGQVSVISGETGCGKTTQVPQFILEESVKRGVGGSCNIVCTQPRRISAIGVAERVASERGERCGDSTGYAIKGESRQVSFQWKNPDFLLKNPDFLLKNVDFIQNRASTRGYSSVRLVCCCVGCRRSRSSVNTCRRLMDIHAGA